MLSSIYDVGCKLNKWWHRIFFGLVSRTLCNAYVVYKKRIEPSIRSLEFHRSIVQSLIILSKQTKVDRPTSAPNHGSAKKRRKVSYKLPHSIRIQNIGAHYVIYKSERRWCDVCSKKVFSQDHTVNITCVMFFYAAMRRKTVLENSIICKNHLFHKNIVYYIIVFSIRRYRVWRYYRKVQT